MKEPAFERVGPSSATIQGRVPKMAWPCPVSHAPMLSSSSCSSGAIVPSGLGPMFSSRLPFLETVSASSMISSVRDLYSWPSTQHQEERETEVSFCQGTGRIPPIVPRSMS